MAKALTECRKYLEGRYRNLLGFQNGFADEMRDRQTAWLSVSLDDLGRTGKDEGHAAVLIDPEIGTLLYLIEYAKDQDVVALVIKALALRTRLLLGATKTTEQPSRDPLGSWRVAVYWLVEEESLFQLWEDAVAQLRADAPHMEEIPIDAIFKGTEGWSAAFQLHRFPRLLLNSRRVLRIENRLDVERWSAADAKVEEGLEGFSAHFTDKIQRELALSVERQVVVLKNQEGTDITKTVPSGKGYNLPRTLGIKHFRNIQQASLELTSEPVSCSVIAGPNGSGKSALFEAISLATFNSSHRYLEYLRDTDAATRRTPDDYVGRYLKNLSYLQWGNPQLHIHDQWESIGLPQSEEEAANIDRLSEGCLLSQERGAEFCKRSSSDLAAEVLRGYSDLANGIQWYVEDEYQKANGERQDLLRSLGMRANITKVDTARQKVAEQHLANVSQFSTSNMVAWLSVTAKDYQDFMPTAERTARLWQRWEERRSDVASQCVTLLEEGLAKESIEKWLTEFNAIASETRRLFGGHVLVLLDHLRSTDSSITEQLGAWGQWLEQRVVSPASGNEQAITSARKELDLLAKQQADIAKRGSLLRARLDHLGGTRTGIEARWVEEHGTNCPTCSSDLSQRGGLSKVLDDLIAETSRNRDILENEFREISGRIKEANAKLVGLGVAPNPITDEQQQVLVGLLGPFLADGVTLEAMLRAPSSRERLVSYIGHLRSSIVTPPNVDVRQVASEVAKLIIEKCITVSTTFNAPNNWAAIRKRLTETLGDIVKSHLPNTLEALWLELVLNLTSAPWLLRLKPAFHARTQRNAQILTIRVGAEESAPLARHILNTAEVNVLGLAWFFVRFITFGRFVLPMMVLDDPAQQMDQTTYRDLCRLLETIVRIHRDKGSKLALVVLFHQEDRALDAARALNATLSVLSWAETQSARSIKRIRVFGDTPPLTPAAVFA